jgi:hypothetical protein
VASGYPGCRRGGPYAKDKNVRVVLAFVLLVAGASAALADPPPADWGGHGGGHGGHHGQHDNGGYDNGTVIVDPTSGPYPYPYPYPGGPLPPPDAPGQPPVGGEDVANIPPPQPLWYYCDKPAGFYPYVKTCEGDWQGIEPAPPPPGAGPPLSEDSWDYCDDAKGYYPYVASCRHHWIAVPATLPEVEMPLDRPPAIAMWFYCSEAKGYFPYVRDCTQNWRMMPSVPPASLPPAPKSTAAVP